MQTLARGKLKRGYREILEAERLGPTAQPLPPSVKQSGLSSPTKKAGVVDHRNKRQPILAKAIYDAAETLGAKVNRARALRELPKSVKRCPAMIAEFYQRIVWRKKPTFQVEIDEIDWDGISFYGPVQEANPHIGDVLGCEGKDLFGVGDIGSNWILMLDGNDKRQSDPTVYQVDHAPDVGEELCKLGRLSTILRSLRASPPGPSLADRIMQEMAARKRSSASTQSRINKQRKRRHSTIPSNARRR
jgi:hypothetical protein